MGNGKGDAGERELRKILAGDYEFAVLRAAGSGSAPFDLPDLHVSDVEQVIWGNTRDFVWPDAGDAVYRTYGPERRPDIYTVNAGAVSPVVDGTDDS